MDLEKVSSTDFSISCNRLLDSGEDDVKIAIFAKCPVDNRPNFNSSIAYVANTPVVAAKDVSPVIFGAFPAAVVNSEESVSEVIPAKSVETYTVETVPAAPKVTNTKPEKSEKIKNIKTKKKNADVRKVAGNSSHFCPVNYERVASKCRMKCARFTIPKSTSPYACIPDEKSKSADNERRVRDREKNRKAWRVVGIVAASVGVAGLATWGIHSIFKDKGDDNSSNTFDRSSVSTFSSNGMAYGSSNSGHQHNYYYNQPSSMYNTGSSYGSYSEPTGSWYGNASYGYPSHGYSSYGGGSGAGTTPTPYSYGF